MNDAAIRLVSWINKRQTKKNLNDREEGRTNIYSETESKDTALWTYVNASVGKNNYYC